ncbi:hypothetical protein [Rhizohabitans arisaemae]|uniref:hypothetical protein n=1 Tax=Rhizohabitans arisaemae TaxID=2720610 RepID=UPI0024B1A497|nr:hypothetical protein [Rhizohabitans arisaemae]
MTDHDRTHPMQAPARFRASHPVDAQAAPSGPAPQTSPPGPPRFAPADPGHRVVPAGPAPQAAPAAPSPVARPAGGLFREEAIRHAAGSRAATRMPLMISGPSFLLLWIVVAALVASGAILAVLLLDLRR